MITDPILWNMIPGQYQIDNLLMGKGTTVRVETCDIKPYDVNNQDYQVLRSDEMRFGFDNFKPTTIELTFNILNNRLLPHYEGLIENFWDEMPTVGDFARAWRNDEARQIWGALKPLYICGKDGITRAVYGRPGQFTYAKDSEYTEVIQCLGEFRRADTLSYTRDENSIELQLSADPVYLVREGGDGPDTWLRLLLVGPLTDPVITIGDQQVKLDYEIEEGNAVEISSYPWQRRAVDANRVNLSANLVGTTYLDKLKLAYGSEIPIKWTSSEANTMVPALGNTSFIQDIRQYGGLELPASYTTINGRAWVKIDLFDFRLLPWQWFNPRKYIGSALFFQQNVIRYNAMKFNTAEQFSSGQITGVETLGKSAICIMSNDDMTSLVCVEVEQNTFLSSLKIRSGGWNSLTTRATWANPSPLGFFETDKAAIKSVVEDDHIRYIAYFNGVGVCSWLDEEDTMPHDENHRSQGYIFDVDGILPTPGVGFCNIISYDHAQEEAQVGKVYLFYRDSWSTIG